MDSCLILTPATKRGGGYRKETERIDVRKDRGWKSTAQHPLSSALGKPFSWLWFHQLSGSVRASAKWDAYLSIRGTGRIVKPGLELGITNKAMEQVIKSEGRNRSGHQCKLPEHHYQVDTQVSVRRSSVSGIAKGFILGFDQAGLPIPSGTTETRRKALFISAGALGVLFHRPPASSIRTHWDDLVDIWLHRLS